MHLRDPQLNPAGAGRGRNSHRGGVLAAVMIITLAITVLLAGLVKWVDVEARVSRRQVLTTKANYAAEAVCEFGVAQMRARLEGAVDFPATLFTASGTPPALPDAALTGSLLAACTSDLLPGAEPPAATVFTVTPLALTVGRFTTSRRETIDIRQPRYTADPLNTQRVKVREVRILGTASVTDPGSNTSATGYCEELLQVRDAPLFGNVAFYNMDLEVCPGAHFHIYGPVHTNRDLYVQSESKINLHFHGPVTAAGRVYHGPSPNSNRALVQGDVSFSNDSSTLVSMKQGGVWIDNRVSDWTARSSTLWENGMRNQDHGVTTANAAGLAGYVPDDPLTAANELENTVHDLIEPAIMSSSPLYTGDAAETQKYANQACLVIEASATGTITVYKYTADSAGNYMRKTATGVGRFRRDALAVPAGLIVGNASREKFYDARRARMINVVDLDIGALKELVESDSAAAQWTNPATSIGFTPSTEWNGIVYIEHKNTTSGALRLVNGEDIPNRPTTANGATTGFTVATNAPAYILGNYNADGKMPTGSGTIGQPDDANEPPAAIAADAVTILSTGWNDSKSATGKKADRKANTTEISAALMTGIVPTNKNGNGTYSGGLQCFPRFLEVWTGVKFGYRGSLVALFESEIATEPWGTSNVYDPPDRDWGFNTLFAEGFMPPGTPTSRTYRRLGFRTLTPAQYATALAEVAP
jgi:hypothetical protein